MRLALLLLLVPGSALADLPATATGLPGEGAEVRIVKAGSVQVGLWPGKAFQGTLLVVDVAGPALQGVRGELLGEKASFFSIAPHVLRGLFAVADDAATGTATLVLKLDTGAGEPDRQELPIEVQPVAFDRDELTVNPRFTHPPASARAQIRADHRALDAMWRKGSPAEPFFQARFQKPLEHDTTAPFGTRRVFNRKVDSIHEGWDINGKVGDPILCDNDGVVRMARKLYYSGGTMFIDHGAGLYTGYFHMSAFAVKEGSRVTKGQLCGKVGKSGRVTGPHLHWAAKLGGHYVHPETLLLFDWEKPMVTP